MAVMTRLADFEKYASEILPKLVWDFQTFASEDRVTYNDNFAALKRYKIIPRLLRDVSKADTSTTVLGHRISFPVCISPSSAQTRAHSVGESGTAKGAAAAGTIFTLSSYSTIPMENVAKDSPDGCKFFNIYLYRSVEVIIDMVRRAERNGYQAIVITCDSPVAGPAAGGQRLAAYRQSVNRVPYEFVNFSYPEGLSYADKVQHALSNINPSATWETVAWLRTITSLPIILKGILSAEDAIKAVDVGAAGILVSNHGGRQLDTVPATIDVLGEIVHAVDGRCEVYMDGGVRTGTDVLKALALGARAVFIGRPALYALAYNGADGVEEMLQILKSEFTAAMSMAGCTNVSEITSSLVRHQNHFPAKI